MQLAEAEARLKQQQTTYEQVRADRNLCSRNLIAAQDEVLELRNRSKILVSPLHPLILTETDKFLPEEHIEHRIADIPYLAHVRGHPRCPADNMLDA